MPRSSSVLPGSTSTPPSPLAILIDLAPLASERAIGLQRHEHDRERDERRGMRHHRPPQRPGRHRFIPVLLATVIERLLDHRVLQGSRDGLKASLQSLRRLPEDPFSARDVWPRCGGPPSADRAPSSAPRRHRHGGDHRHRRKRRRHPPVLDRGPQDFLEPLGLHAAADQGPHQPAERQAAEEPLVPEPASDSFQCLKQ